MYALEGLFTHQCRLPFMHQVKKLEIARQSASLVFADTFRWARYYSMYFGNTSVTRILPRLLMK